MEKGKRLAGRSPAKEVDNFLPKKREAEIERIGKTIRRLESREEEALMRLLQRVHRNTRQISWAGLAVFLTTVVPPAIDGSIGAYMEHHSKLIGVIIATTVISAAINIVASSRIERLRREQDIKDSRRK